MTYKPHDVTAEVVVEFTRHILDKLAEKYGGGITLNELRVMHQIVVCRVKDRHCSVTALYTKTGIPKSTVSRAITSLQDGGWLSERQDPHDGRKRMITLGPRAMEQTSGEINEMIQWINDYREFGLQPARTPG